MADHIRKQIRDAAKTALTGLTTTGANVFSGRISALQASELPGLLIFLNGDEAIEGANNAGTPTVDRSGMLRIEGVAAEGDDTLDLLDQIALEVEAKLFSDAPFMDTLLVPPGPPATSIQVDDAPGGSAKRVGSIIMNFPILFRTELGAPDTQV